MTKTCSICKTDKPVEEFSPHKHGTHGRSPYCRSCDRIRARKWYQDNKDARRVILRDQARARKLKVIEILRPRYQAGCVDCGETNFFILEWDHKDGVDKVLPVSKMWNYSLKRIIEETEKCELRCANCHKIRTAKQLGYEDWMLEDVRPDGRSKERR